MRVSVILIAVLLATCASAQDDAPELPTAVDFDNSPKDGVIDLNEAKMVQQFLLRRMPLLIDQPDDSGKFDGVIDDDEAELYVDLLADHSAIELPNYRPLSVDDFDRRKLPWTQKAGLRAEAFDFNQNGLYEEVEATAASIYTSRFINFDFDQDDDGFVSFAELDAYQAEKELRLEEFLDDYVGESVDVVNSNGEFPKPLTDDILGELEDDHIFKQILIRREYAENSVTSAVNIKSKEAYEQARPAVFSWTRDIEQDTNVWTADGVVMLPLQLGQSDCSVIRTVYLMPSVTFSRFKDESNAGADIDSLIPRMTGELEFVGLPFFDRQYVRAGYTYARDFASAEEQHAFEFEWEPVLLELGIGMNQDMPLFEGIFEYRFRPVFHLEAGRVSDPGNNRQLIRGDDFVRFGPDLTLRILPAKQTLLGINVQRLVGVLRYTYLYGASGVHKASRNFVGEVQYQLDQTGHFTLNGAYINGDQPINRADIEQFFLSLGVKF